MPTIHLEYQTAEVFTPLDRPARYKGLKGGRGSGKSHDRAQEAVLEMVEDPDLRFVCIREIQRSLEYSAKALVEAKIRSMGVGSLFWIGEREIRRLGGHGVMIFEGMQNHTAESMKSLEGFGRAWVEEAHTLSQKSIEILTPTIRDPGSEIWFTWNPQNEDDPVERLLVQDPPPDSIVVHANYTENPFLDPVMREEAELLRVRDPDAFAHIWQGGYRGVSDAQVLKGRYRVDEFTPQPEWDGPYHGADWGFSQDPTAVVRFWIGDRRLWIEYEAFGVGVEMQDLPRLFEQIPNVKKYRIRADNARPETIAYMKRKGFDIIAAKKWKGSVEDGVEWLRGAFDEIVIHVRCTRMQDEAKFWSFKQDRLTNDPLPILKPGHDHGWDAVRYGASPLIKKGPTVAIL